MTKKYISIILCVIICLGIFCSCSGDKQEQGPSIVKEIAPKNGGSFKLGCVSVDTLNPLITSHASVSDFLSLIYEGLFVTYPDLTVEGILAEGYSVSENNTLYTVNLKQNVKFHGGKSFTANDVIATMEYIGKYSSRWSEVMKYIESYTALDNFTVQIKLNTPKSDFAANLDFPILPEGLDESEFLTPNQNFIPVGTGMYKYNTTVAYKNIILKAYDDWAFSDKRAYIDEVNIEILSDEETIVSAFDAGTLDGLTTSWRSFGDLNLTSDLFNTFECEQNRFTFVGINTKDEIFDSEKERHALADKIDTQKIADDIMVGKAVAATSPVREGVYFNPVDEDESPVLKDNKNEFKSEEPIECKILYNSDSKTKSRIAAALKQQMETLGYIVTLDGQEHSVYTDKVVAGDYQLYVGEVQMCPSFDLLFMFSSSESGICNYNDEEFRALLNNLDAVGEKDKEVAWRNFEKYYINSAVQIPLFFTNKASFVNKRIKGSLKANLSSPYFGFDTLFINEG